MKCCTRLATLLYRVVSCCMKFDSDQIFSLNKCCTIQHFFCFPGCYMMLYSFGHHASLLYSRVCCKMWNILLCCTRCCIRLATPLLNTIEQHTTACKKCCMMFYEMLYSFGRGFTFQLLLLLLSVFQQFDFIRYYDYVNRF